MPRATIEGGGGISLGGGATIQPVVEQPTYVAPAPTPTYTVYQEPAPVVAQPVVVDTGILKNLIDEAAAAAPTADPTTQLTNFAVIVATAIAASEPVVASDEGSAPAPDVVQAIAEQVAQLAAPSIAPAVSPDALATAVDSISSSVASNPQIVSSAANTPVTLQVINDLVAPITQEIASNPAIATAPATSIYTSSSLAAKLAVMPEDVTYEPAPVTAPVTAPTVTAPSAADFRLAEQKADAGIPATTTPTTTAPSAADFRLAEQAADANMPATPTASSLQDAVIALVNGTATPQQLADIGATTPTPSPAATEPQSAADFRLAEQKADAGTGAATGTGAGTTPPVGGTTGITQADLDKALADQQAKYEKLISDIASGNADALKNALADAGKNSQNALDAALAAQTKANADLLAAQQKQYEDQIAAQNQAARKSAYEVMKSRFEQMGVPELGTAIEKIFKGNWTDRTGKTVADVPTSSEGFYLALLDTKEYYDRFGSLNEQRVKAGFTALDEKTILGMEDQYQKVMQAYSMPKGFYDTYADFQTFLKNDKSASEVADDIQAYSDFVDQQAASRPDVFNALSTYYGIGKAELTAYYADPAKGQPVLEQIAGKNKNTAAALIQGLSESTAQQAQGFGAGSLAYATLKQKYSAVAQDIATTGKLADIYGMNYGQKEAVASEFGGEAASLAQQQRIRQTSLAQFSGMSGIGSKALGRRTGGL